MIHVYNINTENHEKDENNYFIHRPYILGNPYTHIKDRQTLARFVVKSREEAIEKYSHYFDVMYGGNKEFKKVVDEIYDKYVKGEEIYLGCVCAPLPCHGEVIMRKMQQRRLKEKIQEAKHGIR